MSCAFQAPLDHPDDREDDHTAGKNATDVTCENSPLGRIQETVYIDSLSRVGDIRHSQITSYYQPPFSMKEQPSKGSYRERW